METSENSESTSTPQDTRTRIRRPTRDLPPIPADEELEPPKPPEKDIFQPSKAPTSNEPSSLTPLRAHYLKKTLISLQLKRELDDITTAPQSYNVSTLSYLGPPFTPPPKNAPPLDLPFLRYIFRQFVLTFPFLAAAPKTFYPDKLQPFISSLLSRNLSASSVMDLDGNDDEAARMKFIDKIEKQFSLLLVSATKLHEQEEVVRLTQADLARLEALAERRRAKGLHLRDLFEVNVVCVRIVHDRGRVRSRIHEEFIVRTRRPDQPDVFVSRRYGDFKNLAQELRKMHPDEIIPPPPSKDRTASNGNATSPTISNNDSEDYLPSPLGSTNTPFRLVREKNRLTLRAYIHALMSTSTVASSPVLRSFLLSGPTQLTQDELEDGRRREEADQRREDGRKRFAREIVSRIDGLKIAVKNVQGDVMAKDGLSRIFSIIRMTEDVRDLPPDYRAVLEWGRISLASTVFQQFVAADDASENLAGLKRIHGLVPYFLLKGVLRISNPVGMIRGVMDLFLSQPFGGRSLLQRMFTSSLQEEVRALEENIDAIQQKVDDPIICEKVRQFIYAPREIQAIYRADAEEEKIHLLAVILRSGEEPALSRPQLQRVVRAHRAYALYMKHKESLADSDDDDGPQDNDAWLFEDLTILAKMYSQLRDKEQLIALIFEGNTADLLKDIITIFYSPLAQVYKAASIADSLGDLQNFINDLIRTVEDSDELTQQDPGRIVQAFIDLISRHEQSFYSFIHKVHSKGEGLFDSLMRWIELFLTAVREGFGGPISLEFILPHTGQDRLDILKEVDDVALYHYKLKLAHQNKVRKRFGRTQGRGDADAEDEAAQALLNGVVQDISFGDLVKGDVDEFEAEDEDGDDDSEDEDDSEYETSSEENSEESGPSRVPTPLSRSHTIGPSSKPGGQTSIRPEAQRGVTPVRSQSLMSGSHRGAPRRPPSVPSLSRVDATSLPLNPRPPARHDSVSSFHRSDPPPSLLSKDLTPQGPSAAPTTYPRKPKKPIANLNPPELKRVPELLPVFVEMMRPLLQTRNLEDGR